MSIIRCESGDVLEGDFDFGLPLEGAGEHSLLLLRLEYDFVDLPFDLFLGEELLHYQFLFVLAELLSLRTAHALPTFALLTHSLHSRLEQLLKRCLLELLC